ncbi:MAG: methyltransferase [Bacteroidota bacterium]
MYQLKNEHTETLSFETHDAVFKPTGTTTLLLESVKENIEQPGRLLDLGCGIGVVGIALAKYKLASSPLYASDISEEAVKLTELNARQNSCEVVAKAGKVFEPWSGYRFDYIVDDVSGIAEDIAAVSDWFKNVSCESGYDGSILTREVISRASAFLTENGKLFFPVISLSNTRVILEEANIFFKAVKLLKRKTWPLPNDLKPHMDMLLEMKEKGVISFEEKFGIFTWTTDIYMAHN